MATVGVAGRTGAERASAPSRRRADAVHAAVARLVGRPVTVDLALALLVLANELSDVGPSGGANLDGNPSPVAAPLPALPTAGLVALLTVQCLALAVRRRAPGTVLVVVAALAVVAVLTGDEKLGNISIPVMVAGYSVAVHARHRRLGAGLVVLAVVGLGLLPYLLARQVVPSVGHAAVLAVPVVTGYAVRARRAAVARIRARADAVAAERAQLARELHDVVAQAMSVVALNSAAAGRVVETDPAAARRALDTIGDAARDALGEMHQFVRVLRDEEPGAGPGLAQVDGLVARVRAGGVAVDLDVDPALGGLPPITDRTAYRVVQEGFSNALTHAPGARVTVRVARVDGAVEVSVADDGRRRGPSRGGGLGRGLAGLRERVELGGGEFRAAFGPDGGSVTARLPVPPPS